MGGSTSIVKPTNKKPSENENRRHQQPHSSTQEPTIPKHLEPESIKCRKHIRHDVTHICESTQELMCLNCAQRMINLTEHKQSCVDIESYTNSLKFKQVDSRTTEQLRSRKTFLDEELKRIDYSEKRVLGKRDEMVDEVKTFIGRLVELVRHMEKDLYTKVNSTIDNYVTNLRHRKEYIQTWKEELVTMQDNINRHKSQKANTVLHLKSALDCKTFVTSIKANVHPMKETPDFRLKLNKLLTLKDIVGRKESTGNISLGEIFNARDNTRGDHLSTISENDIRDDISTTRESIKTTKHYGSARVSERMSENNDLVLTDIHEDTVFLDENRVISDEVKSNSDTRENRVYPDSDIMKIDSGDISRTDLPSRRHGHTRNRFGKDTELVGNVQRSNSPTKSLSRRLSNPRISNNSIISPMSVTSPSRINLLPTREAIKSVNGFEPHRNSDMHSVHGRIAVRIKTIKILCEGDIPNFTDSLVLDDGKIVLCDQKNEKLILLNSSFKQLDELLLRGQPHNVTKTTTDNKTIAVTIPDKNMIQFVWVLAQRLEDPNKSITSEPKCRGITYIENNLLYTSRNDVIVLKEGVKEKPWKFDCVFREPVSLHADKRSNALFVCCIGLKSSGEVVKIDFDKQKVEQIMSFSDIKQPVCCSCDSDQNIYICDIDPPRIHLVSRGGQYCRLVLDSTEGNIQHIKFCPGSDVFITTENNSEDINVYELR